MKKFKVYACYYTYCTAVVEADLEEEAFEIARAMDGSDFTASGELSDWHINNVEEIKDETNLPVRHPSVGA